MSTETLDTSTLPLVRPATPLTGWRRALGDWFVVGQATVVCQILGAATSLLLRALLDPAQMGVWQAVKLLLGYGNYANLGISKGALREYTIARGRQDTADARRDLNLAMTFNTLSSVLYGGLLAGVGLWLGWTAGGDSSWAWSLGLLTAAAMAVLSRYVTYRVTILWAEQDFTSTARLSILEATLTLVVGCAATYLWGLAGLYFSTLLVVLASLVYVLHRPSVSLGWAWNTARIGQLIGIGGPILLVATVSTLFRSLDKMMILAYLSDREYQLGCYSLALLVSTQLFGLGNMFSTVMGPRYGEKYGASGSRREVARLAARASELQAAAMVLPAALALVAGVPILARILPAYRAGVASTWWLVPGTVALCLTLPASQYLMTVNQQRRALYAVLVATGFGAVANHVALVGGYGLNGVGAATCLAYVVYWALTVGVSLWIDLEPRERLRYLGMSALAVGPTLAAALGLAHWQRVGEASWTQAALSGVLVTVVWALSALAGWRWGGWRAEWRGLARARD